MSAIRLLLLGVILLLVKGCNSPESMFVNNVNSQVSRVRNLEFGQISCMHCPMYFKFEADKSFVKEIIQEHALARVDSLPHDISLMLRLIDVPWWIREKDIDASEKFLIEPRFSISALSGRMKWRKSSGQVERFCGIPQTLHPCALLHRDSEV